MQRGMTRLLAAAIVALAAAPATAVADEPATAVSVTVVIGSQVTAIDPEPAEACAPELTMRLDQRPLRWRRGLPVLRAGRSYRFAGRLTCAPEGTAVEIEGQASATVGPHGRVVARVAYRGARTVAFTAQGTTVRIAVRAGS